MYQGASAEENSQSSGKLETAKVDPNANPELFNFGEPLRAVSELTNKTVDNVENSIVLIDASMRDVVNKMGQGENLSDGIRKNIADAAPLVTKLGGDTKAALQVQLDSLDVFGRNILLTEEQIEGLYAVNKVTGVGVKELETGFADAGMSIEHISQEMLTVRETANALGVNAKAVSANVVANLDKMNRYSFEGGVQGLAKMAARAQALRIDMKTTFDLADQLMSPEKAIEVSSALQRLGATTTSLVDPLKLMDMAQNDVGALQQELGEMFKTYTAFDEKSGKFEIMPGARRQLKEIGDALNIPIKEMERMALGSADLEKKLSEISFGGLDLTEEQQEMIANMSTMGEGGEYKIKVKDETGELVEKGLTQVLKDYQGREGELTTLLSEQQAEEGKTPEEKMLMIAERQLDELSAIRSGAAATAMKPGMKVAGSEAAREILEFNRETGKIVNDQLERLFDNQTINNAIDSFGGQVGKLNERIKEIYGAYEKSGFKDTDKLKVDLSLALKDATKFGADFGKDFMTGLKDIVKNMSSITPFFGGDDNETPPKPPSEKDENEELPFKKPPSEKDENEELPFKKPPPEYTEEEIKNLSTKLNPLKIQTTNVEIDGINLKDMMPSDKESDNQKTIKIDDGIIDVKNSQAIPLEEGTIVKYNPKDNIYQTKGNLIATTNNLTENNNNNLQTNNTVTTTSTIKPVTQNQQPQKNENPNTTVQNEILSLTEVIKTFVTETKEQTSITENDKNQEKVSNEILSLTELSKTLGIKTEELTSVISQNTKNQENVSNENNLFSSVETLIDNQNQQQQTNESNQSLISELNKNIENSKNQENVSNENNLSNTSIETLIDNQKDITSKLEQKNLKNESNQSLISQLSETLGIKTQELTSEISQNYKSQENVSNENNLSDTSIKSLIDNKKDITKTEQKNSENESNLSFASIEVLKNYKSQENLSNKNIETLGIKTEENLNKQSLTSDLNKNIENSKNQENVSLISELNKNIENQKNESNENVFNYGKDNEITLEIPNNITTTEIVGKEITAPLPITENKNTNIFEETSFEKNRETKNTNIIEGGNPIVIEFKGEVPKGMNMEELKKGILSIFQKDLGVASKVRGNLTDSTMGLTTNSTKYKTVSNSEYNI